MPRANSFVDDEFDTFPIYVRRAFEADASFAVKGYCRTRDGVIKEAWTVLPSETLIIDGGRYEGRTLIKMALELCRICPVQWECATFALTMASEPTYIWGTWGADATSLRWLKKRGKLGTEIIRQAESTSTPVQVAVKLARRTARADAA